ncbi:TonB-dependent siderophore receptor [Chryseobacterium sp. BIGb0232]|uniref:TonB-dependent receptor plug domain-containing protein n=1 Tax=Chryseobacterium sp. BIGb0232 TaxID=2940598 RepID=UPI000F48A7C6|nr:TonB-dependent receptor [Chryseobacterium sp. BIGb0232]MCS4303582.1 iron complex outermembrane receptor protein [Chryseobacterium sp. BIGb0232]ROS10281.1 iron complex outermembrane receptor protein [Chryseobacterium nakagawai]
MKKLSTAVLLIGTILVAGQEQEEKGKQIEDIIIVGNRNVKRTKLETPVPVDVINIDKIQKSSPQMTAQDLLNYVIPSFNSVRQSASDGTEHIDPVTLRGMGPDQVLVLLNGKRRHTTSLVNYQNTVGNGSVGTDLSTIPVIAIEKIEVLRDGAAAQYGSDAIAGVINIILKKNAGASASLTYGLSGRNDGDTYQAGVNYGTSLGKNDGFINLSLQLSHRGKTTRTQNHDLDIYGNNFAYEFADNPDVARQNDDDEIRKRGLTRDDFNFQIGDAQIRQGQLFFNSEYPLNDNFKFYSFGGFSIKEGKGYGFRRLPNESFNIVKEIYPNGFQAVLNSQIYDISYAVGAKYNVNSWLIDLSNTFGSNTFNYNVGNTNNASLGIKSPTRFYAGAHSFLQNTVNLDVSKKIKNFNIAFGGEFRFEQYQIKAGDEASYTQYDESGNVATKDSKVIGAGGSQSFIGFSPDNALKKDRHSTAVYADVSYDLDKKLNIDAAARFENYSDFGNTLNGKLAVRYEFVKNYAVRAAVGTGFRAPSLQQQYFNNSYADISTSGDGIVRKGIFNNESIAAQVLGFDKLKQETSVNGSVGFTLKPAKGLFITVDGYIIKVKDRIVITSNITDSRLSDISVVGEGNAVESGRFFANAVDTETKGVDVVVSYDWKLGGGNLNINLAGNYTETKITDFHFPDKLETPQNEFFGPDQINIIETLSPKTKASLGLTYGIGKLNFLVRNTYFGKVIRDGFPFGIVQEFSPKAVTDVSVGYDITKNINLTVGANNVFDVFPDLQTYKNSYYGVFKYAPVQMGTLGSYFFGRLNFNF